MEILLRVLPFVAAEFLLIWGVLQLCRIAFIASFVVLLLAAIYAIASEPSSEIFGFIGSCVNVFGLSCVFLAERVGKGAFISKRGLGKRYCFFWAWPACVFFDVKEVCTSCVNTIYHPSMARFA
ncbi:MAG: hypothetical protein ABSA47_04640 [Verrucomicrobiota bacterium]|jgi:hypothetical protein